MRVIAGTGAGRNLLEVLLAAADAAPDQVIVHVRDDGRERTVSFRELRDSAMRVAGGYRAAGVAPGTPAAGFELNPIPIESAGLAMSGAGRFSLLRADHLEFTAVVFGFVGGEELPRGGGSFAAVEAPRQLP